MEKSTRRQDRRRWAGKGENMKFLLFGLLLSFCVGCSKNVNLLKDINSYNSANKITKSIELCINVDSVTEPYIKRPTGHVGSAVDFIFPLKSSLASKTEYGFSRIFNEIHRCNDSSPTDYKMTVAYNNVDLTFACSYASGNFDEGGFSSIISFDIEDKKNKKKIHKSKSVAQHLRHTGVGGDMLLTNQAIDKALVDYLNYFETDTDISNYFKNEISDTTLAVKLKQLEAAYAENVISEAEYKESRKRILQDFENGK